MTNILTQLAHSTFLPQPLSAAILSGSTPPMSELIYHLLIGSMDCEVVTTCDKKATWNERRISRQLLGLTFLTALLLEQTFGPEHSGTGTAVGQERES